MNIIKKNANMIVSVLCLALIISCKTVTVTQDKLGKEEIPPDIAGPAIEEQKTGCLEGDCENGTGTFYWENGSKYTGEFKNGAMHGKGTFYFEGSAGNRGKYVGDFKNGFIEGSGTWTWDNGDKYVGETKYNKMHGKGIYYYSNGTVKKGIWFNDKFFKEEEEE